MSRKKPYIVLFDLETMPNMEEAMKIFPKLSDYPGLTLKATINSIICFGFKVYGKKKAKCINAWDFPGWKKDINDDFEICKAAYGILKDATAVVTHNGKRFDWKFLQTRLLFHKLPMLPKILHVDTCAIAKRNLLSFNNSLNILAKAFGEKEKLENGGWDLWVRVRLREASAMRLMEQYCKQDVEVLEEVFEKLKSLTNDIPDHNMFKLEGNLCPKCGSLSLIKSGKRVSKTRVYQRILCNSCGSYCTADLKGKLKTF